jgi:hypothetical protein
MFEREKEAWTLVRNLLVQLAELVSRSTLELNDEYSGRVGANAQAEIQRDLGQHLRRLSMDLDREPHSIKWTPRANARGQHGIAANPAAHAAP